MTCKVLSSAGAFEEPAAVFLRLELLRYFACLLDVLNEPQQSDSGKPSLRPLNSSRKLGDMGQSSHRKSKVSSVSWVVSRNLERCPQGSVGFKAGRKKKRKILALRKMHFDADRL